MEVTQEQFKLENMSIVIVGHVDHGKSTIIGRLMADTGSLPEGKLEQVRERCRRNARPFEYAYLLDALKDEQEQGITIDSARCFFKSSKRNYIIIDAPGHIEFLKNMVSGAARAEAALLVIDANEGIQENTRRHGYLLSMLGIRQVCILVNKMDLVDYSQTIYDQIVMEYSQFLKEVGTEPTAFIPISGFNGDNIIDRSESMPWYAGTSVMGALEDFKIMSQEVGKPFRMPVQGVYKFTANGDDRRIIAGTVESGTMRVGDQVVFYPSGKKSTVKSIEGFNTSAIDIIESGMAAGFTLTEQIYVKRGEVAVLDGEVKPNVAKRFQANLLWLGKESLVENKQYILKVGTLKTPVYVERILRVLNTSSLAHHEQNSVQRHEVAECIFVANNPVAFDLAEENIGMGRFVIVDQYNIAGGGIILKGLPDHHSAQREQVTTRNYKWVKSDISEELRESRYGQKSALIIVTGPKDTGKKSFARKLEKTFFDQGRLVYFMGIANVLYGIDADIKKIGNANRDEHIRRLSEVANILMDAGVILVVTAIDLNQEDIDTITTSVDLEKVITIWCGVALDTEIAIDYHVPRISQDDLTIRLIQDMLTSGDRQ